MYSKPTVYMYVSQKAVCAVCEQHFFPCVFTSSTFSNCV